MIWKGRRMTIEPPYEPRDGASLVFYPSSKGGDDCWHLLNGWNPDGSWVVFGDSRTFDTNEHWKSADLITWTLVGSTPYVGHCQWAGIGNNKLLLVGNDSLQSDTEKNKIYSYTPGDGWTTESANMGFGYLIMASWCIHSVGGTEYLYCACGMKDDSATTFNNSIWRKPTSSLSGSFTKVADLPVELQDRGYAAMYSVNGKVIITGGAKATIGGAITTLYDSTYISEDNGVNFSLQGTDDRLKSTYPNGCQSDSIIFFLKGGVDGHNTCGLFYSEDEGATWKEVAPYFWFNKRHASGFASDGASVAIVTGNMWADSIMYENILNL